ncbi:pentatricopeptide repeat-containing protein At1g05750, chloroplastic [Magnolia sinica]|uniref:pentatricopeptide repeat-containing protein At1g05750, chloroplastic n=1 Tax=Magnolia sinica TaxID=86752 RepID=UPI0026582C5E|nr:pentatricopeptide repeat-containing protein At1g05750, chloroplastic [Magnolia sinica]
MLAMHARYLLSCIQSTARLTTIAAAAAASASAFRGSGSGQIHLVDVSSYNQAIDKFIKSGSLIPAIQLFEDMPDRDVISWNLIIAGHARHGLPERALDLFKEMVFQGIKESPSTFSSILGICSDAGFYREGKQIHCRVTVLGFGLNVFVGSALIGLYMQAGFPDLAMMLFDELLERNLVTWNLVLRGFCELGLSDELLEFFSRMKSDGINANCITFSYLIRGCSNGGFLDRGKQAHCHVIKLGWIPANLFIANGLVDLYSACGCLADAKKSFEFIPVEDVISWNSIVSIHADHGLLLEALKFFYGMQLWGKKPSVRAFNGFLNASSRSQNLVFGEQIHGSVLKLGLDRSSLHVQSALIDMYGKCSEIQSSVSVFDEMPEKNLECCNSLITSFLHCGIIDDAVEMFGLMMDECVRPDHVTFSATLKASSLSFSGGPTTCQLLQCCVIKSGFESDIAVSCSLIDAYSRCSDIERSRQIFEWIPKPNVICYTAIISGFARKGMGIEGLQMLKSMVQEGLEPDAVTFLSVLSGCDHSGLVEEGQSVFKSMKDIHGVHPDRRHYSCMVNLLGRAGLLEEAKEMLRVAPVEGNSVMWSSLLQSCIVHGNEKMGAEAVNALMELEPEDPATYLQVSNFYNAIGDSERSKEIREKMVMKKMRKEIGYSLIEVIDCPDLEMQVQQWIEPSS